MTLIARRKTFLLIFTILTISILSLGISSKRKKSPQTLPNAGYVLAKESNTGKTIEISGFVKGSDRADISPMISGKIISILKREGDDVKKGQTLAIIEANQADAQLNAATQSVQALEKTVTESEKYYDQLVDQAKESGANNETIKSAKRARDLQIQAANSQLAAAKGALEIAKSGKGNLILKAPFDGTVAAIHSREGGFANFSMPLVSLSTKDNKEIETFVPKSEGRNIAIGTIVNFETENKLPVTGKVIAISPATESSNFKNLLRISLDDKSETIGLGDFLKGKIFNTSEKTFTTIPRQAIVSRQGFPVVFVIDEKNIAKEYPIKIEHENLNEVTISEGVISGQKIVVDGQHYLKSNIEVLPYESR